ncbi:MAG: CPBP family intramembrane metalloprotease, partial [Candidatus Woesearchaeota archaeon]|nr:CPBP family intramembrane metalloprotease [Candidatus Woesearchaeota archaeon]
INDNIKPRYTNAFSTILIPIAVILLIKIPLIRVIGVPNVEGHFLVNIILFTIFSPIFEEVFFRGILIGIFFYFIKTKIKINYLTGGLYIILLSLFFSFLHKQENIQFFILVFDGIIYSIFYLINKNNILPPIIAHSTSNFIILFYGLFK